jgi:hypothetical protein
VTFPENHNVYQMMWKNTIELERPQMTMWRMRIHVGYLMLQTDTNTICNTYWFSAAIVVTRPRLNVTLYVHCLSCYVPSHLTLVLLYCFLEVSHAFFCLAWAALRTRICYSKVRCYCGGAGGPVFFMHFKCHSKIPFRHPLACLKLPHGSLPCQAELSFAK